MAGAGATKNSTAAKSSSSAAIAKRNNNHHHHHTQPPQTPSTRRQNLLQLVAVAASATAAAHSFLTTHDLTLHPSQTLTLESNISNVSLSISNLLSLIHHPIAFAVPRPPPPPPSWFHRLMTSHSDPDTDQLFIESFRMSKQSFSYILPLLTPSLSSLPIPPNIAVAAALFRLAHAASFNAVARRFDLDSPTACRVFYMVCKAIIDNLGHFFELRSDLNRIVLGFGWISLPNCCGVLGIDTFPVKGNLFGENGSVMVQALIDSEGRFLDVSAGWPSTMKPELVLRQSELYSAVEESRELLTGPSYELNDGSSIPQYILGESCFPLLPWLITPFGKSDTDDDDVDDDDDDDDDGCLNLSSLKQAFNSVHNRGMELVDTAFGRLRSRWRILGKEWKEESIESFPYVVVACCLLHNFLIKSSEEFPDEDSDYMRNHELSDYEGEGDESGERIRSAIASHLSRWEDC